MSLGSCKLLDRLLQSVGLLLSEADTGPLEHLRLYHEILNLRLNRIWLRNDTLFVGLGLGEVRRHLLDVTLRVFGDLDQVSLLQHFQVLAWVDVLLNHERDLLETLHG